MLAEYLKSLSSLGKLTQEKERELWTSYKKEENQAARTELIEHYQILVCKEALSYSVQETVLLDLIQEGTVGLMEAVELFNPDLGVAFSLYAIHRVRGRILNFLKKEQKDILLSEQREQRFFLEAIFPDTAFEEADKGDLRTALFGAMEKLPERERDVITHVYLEERSVAETAISLSVSSTYVYQLEKRGIRRLRGILSRLIHERK